MHVHITCAQKNLKTLEILASVYKFSRDPHPKPEALPSSKNSRKYLNAKIIKIMTFKSVITGDEYFSSSTGGFGV